MDRHLRRTEGFSLVEVMVATTIMLVVVAGVFTAIEPAQATFQRLPELADMQQRVRIAADSLYKDLAMAGAGASRGSPSGPLSYLFAPVMPFRWGNGGDPPGTYRADAITIGYVAPTSTTDAVTSCTDDDADETTLVHASCVEYFLKADDAAGVYQLVSSEASSPDVPIADNVVLLAFEYFGDPQPPAGTGLVKLTPAELSDGPWRPSAVSPNRWDSDLLRIRKVGVTVRVQAALTALRGPAGPLFMHGGTSTNAAKWAPDQEIHFDVTPRNMNLGR